MENVYLDIVRLFENNPLIRLNNDITYNNKFIEKIKAKFSLEEQRFFVANFYCFLNYNPKTDFIIDLEKIWKWLGFSRKSYAKRTLEKNFEIETDYKVEKFIEKTDITNPPKKQGGQNRELITMSINTFKKLCFKVGTKEADKIIDLYLKTSDLIIEIVNEESNELKQLLQTKDNHIKTIETKLDKYVSKTKRITCEKKECIYVGQNEIDRNHFKVGITNNASSRETSLSTGTISDFKMQKIWYTPFHKQIEEAVQKNFFNVRAKQRKEFYEIAYYDEICKFINKLAKTFSELNFVTTKTEHEPDNKTKEIKTVSKEEIKPEKVCTFCRKVKPLEEFNNAGDHIDGKENVCKPCRKHSTALFREEKRKTEGIPSEKACTQCKQVKSLNEYYTDNEKFDKKGTKCKACFLSIRKKTLAKPKLEVTEYKCNLCKLIKPISEFHKEKDTKTGYAYRCKECACAKGRQNYDANLKKSIPDIL